MAKKFSSGQTGEDVVAAQKWAIHGPVRLNRCPCRLLPKSTPGLSLHPRRNRRCSHYRFRGGRAMSLLAQAGRELNLGTAFTF